MDALRKNERVFSDQTMNCQPVAFLLKKIYSSLLIFNQFCLEWSGEWLFYHQIMESEEKSETLIQYP